MSLGLGMALIAAGWVLIEVLSVFLGLWSDRLTQCLRRGKHVPERRFPWSDRTGT